MARILFTVWPFAGCIHPQIAVARWLAARGHAIAFYSGETCRAVVEQQGFEFFPFQGALQRAVDEFVYSPDAIGVNWSRPWRLRPQIRRLFLDTVRAQVEDLEPLACDGIVTDPAFWSPFLILAESRRLPVAILSYACGCMLPGPDLPPVGPGLPVAKTGLGRLRNRVAGVALDWFLSDIRRGASALRQQFGLTPFRGPVIGLAERLPLYLVPSCPEFDYRRRDLPANVHYTGPLQWYPPQPAPAVLDELADDRPWVHVTEGTLHVRDPFLIRAAVSALADLPVRVILGAFDDRATKALPIGALPENMTIVKWVGHDHLLPRTAVMVTTAGGGTVMAGMQHGVPLVVVPTEWDKAENAQRVVEAGAGIRLRARACTPPRLRAAVREILANDSYRKNAQRIAASLAPLGGAARAAVLIEQMLPAGPPARDRMQQEQVCLSR
jgi:UDP:flavonoid glycosyltransferase YjiC (YdhE family)